MVKVTFCWERAGDIPSWSMEASGVVTQFPGYPQKEINRAIHTIEQFFLESERRRCLGYDEPKDGAAAGPLAGMSGPVK